MKWNVGVYEHDGCPQKLLTRERLEVFMAWARWKRFGAPWAIGWAQWPARFLDMMELLEGEVEKERQRVKDQGNG